MAETKKTLRGGIGNVESVIITAVEERGPRPEPKPTRIKPTPLPREVNTLTADDEADREEELRVGVKPDDTGEHAILKSDTAEIPVLKPVAAVPVETPPPGFVDPITAATRAAIRARVRRIAVTAVLTIPLMVFAAVLWAMPFLTALYALGGTAAALVFVGPTIKDTIENGLYRFVTAKVWVEIAAGLALVAGIGLFWVTGNVAAWMLVMSVAVVSLIVKHSILSVRVAQAENKLPVVVELREETPPTA